MLNQEEAHENMKNHGEKKEHYDRCLRECALRNKSGRIGEAQPPPPRPMRGQRLEHVLPSAVFDLVRM